MIPRTLQLKNFLSYGAELQTIDFTPHRLIHLSGKNGHGKSALLDAITWALWGQARKITNAVKPDQGLLRLGQTHMMVIFDFELNGQRYRVRREYECANNKQVAHLEFGIVHATTGLLSPLTDKTIRATQAVLEKTIRLDYESFVNSAFLRQGHANEFSQKSPKDRKDILGTILGLQQFDLLKRRAMDRIKEVMAQRQAVHAVVERMIQQLPHHKEVLEQLSAVGNELCEIDKQEGQLRIAGEQCTQDRMAYGEKQKAHELMAFKKQQHDVGYHKQLEQLRPLVARWRMITKKQRLLPRYQDLEQRKKECIAQRDQQQKMQQERLSIQEAILKKKSELHATKITIEQQHAAGIHKLQMAQERLQYEQKSITTVRKQDAQRRGGLEQRDVVLQKNFTELVSQSWSPERLVMQEAQFEKRKNMYQQFLVKNDWLKAELDALKQKHDFAHEDNPSCPMCEQNLSASRRKFLRNKFEKQQMFLMHQHARLSTVVIRLKQLLIDQHKELGTHKERGGKREAIEKERIQVQSQIKEVIQQDEAYACQLKMVDEQLQIIQKELKEKQEIARVATGNDQSYQKGANELASLEAALKQVPYDEHVHTSVQQKVHEVEAQMNDYLQVRHELHMQQERFALITQSIAALKQQKKERIQYEKELALYATLSKEGESIATKEKQLDELGRTLRAQKEQAVALQAKLKHVAEQFEQMKKELELHQQQIQKLNAEIDDYQTIALAVGKDGIQALLIEEAIPEIEQEANHLLAKLTNNQAQIFIESLRDLKRGGSKETLDVNIADPSGIRPYELFSGGEAFRIDFALRIAISKLLARRAGTSLQTLIIDEGFGSQDEEGLSHIMDAIHRIQDDFEKVIVVSHLPTMRDQFPVHFMVYKGMNGSQVQVIEQG